jgi:hypothetical protein
MINYTVCECTFAGIGRRYEPPSPEEAQEDIYAHIQLLLSPSPSPALSGGGRRFLFPTTKYDQRSGEMTSASWISHGERDCIDVQRALQ